MNNWLKYGILCSIFILLGVGSTLAESISSDGSTQFNQNLRNGHTLGLTTQTIAQTFNITNFQSVIATSVDFNLIKTADEADKTVRASIYATTTDGITPTGTAVVYKDVPITTLNTSAGRVRFTFDTPQNLTGSQQYSIVITYDGSSTAVVRGYTKDPGDYALGRSAWKGDGNAAWETAIATTADFNFVLNYDVAQEVTLLSPPDNDHNDSLSIDFTYNATGWGSGPDSCVFYLDGNSNQTDSSVSANTTQQFNVNFTADGSYSWNVGCTYSGTEYNATVRTLVIDTVQPVISTTGISNGMPVAIGILRSDMLRGIINLTDTNLYSINISTDVEQIYYNNTLSPITVFNYTLAHNISAYAPGQHTLTIRAADGHTTKWIPEYKNSRSFDKKELKYDFGRNLLFKKDYVNIKTDSGTMSTTKQYDRYLFHVEDKSVKSTRTFIVESDHYIDIVQSEYAGHLVIPALNKWIDFEIDDSQQRANAKYHIRRISDNEVEVKITGLTAKALTFNSIGDLNVNEINYTFYVINATESYDSQVAEGESSAFGLVFTANETYTITADLYYNGTAYPSTGVTNSTHVSFSKTIASPLISVAQQNLSFYWNFTIAGPSQNESNTTTSKNQTISQYLIDDCSVYTTQALNYTFLDEEAFTVVTVNVSALIEYNYTSRTRTYGQSFTNVDNIAFCLNPAYANVTGDITIQYENGESSRDYLTTNTQIDNATDFVSLYLPGAGTSEISITVVNPDDESQQGVIVEAYRYNLSNAEFYLVESEVTDVDGRSIFELFVNGPFYKFIIYQDGVLRLETTQFKITQTSYEFTIGTAQEAPTSNWIKSKEIQRNLTFTNSTKTVLFEWNDVNEVATMYCLNVSYSNLTTLHAACSTDENSQLTYVVTNTTGSYIANAYATIGSTERILETKGFTISGLFTSFGRSIAVGIALLIWLVLAPMGLSSPKSSIVFGAGILVSIFFIKLLPISVAGILSIVVVAVVLVFSMHERRGA